MTGFELGFSDRPLNLNLVFLTCRAEISNLMTFPVSANVVDSAAWLRLDQVSRARTSHRIHRYCGLPWGTTVFPTYITTDQVSNVPTDFPPPNCIRLPKPGQGTMKASFFILFAAIVVPLQASASVLLERLPTGPIGYAAQGWVMSSCLRLNCHSFRLFRTTGGAGGTTTRVSTLANFASAVAGDAKKTVILTGISAFP